VIQVGDLVYNKTYKLYFRCVRITKVNSLVLECCKTGSTFSMSNPKEWDIDPTLDNTDIYCGVPEMEVNLATMTPEEEEEWWRKKRHETMKKFLS
jgi:hypothetical protein